ncbi:hypothetical protein IAT40_001521 [Kwoniella sp. CBS 6097]
MLFKPSVIFATLSLLSVSLAWEPSQLTVELRKSEDRDMDRFEQDFKTMCKLIPPAEGGEPCEPEWAHRGKNNAEASEPGLYAVAGCFSKKGDGAYEGKTKEVCKAIGCVLS